MKVCDVVLNSIWYDPRVRRQITAYRQQNVELVCVGMRCNRYDKEKINQIPCPTDIVCIDESYEGKQKSIVCKLIREYLRIIGVRDAIIEQKPDIIHANDLNALIPAFWAKKKLNCKLVYDSHEIWVENFFSKKQILAAKVYEIIENFLIKRIDLMVCVSHAAGEYFMKKYHIPMPMVITNCALESDSVALTGIKKHDGFEVLNHGQFYEGRGYDIMAHACDLLYKYPEVKLAIRGFGRMEDTLREIVAQSRHKEQFLFYPGVLVQDMIPLAAKSHVGIAITEPICLNFKLSVSNKLFEYAAAGLPVIMSDIPEHRYLNERYDFGLLLNENSPQALAEAIIKLYTDPDLYARLSQNSRHMSEKVNWENEFAQLIDAEQNMIS